MKLHLPVKPIIKKTIFGQFCGGESIEDCQSTAQKLYQSGVGSILDYSVEGADNEAVDEVGGKATNKTNQQRKRKKSSKKKDSETSGFQKIRGFFGLSVDSNASTNKK